MDSHLIKPLEQLELGSDLDGSNGALRPVDASEQMIKATTDLEAIDCWLAEYAASPNSLRAYRKEAERLVLWSIAECKKPLSSLLREDLRAYLAFIENPQPASCWVGPQRKRDHHEWRPFHKRLSEASIQRSIAALKSLFGYLHQSSYIVCNPFVLTRIPVSHVCDDNRVYSFFEKEAWQKIVAYADALPALTSRQLAVKERIIYLLQLFYYSAARISEIVLAKMHDLKQIRGKWWLTILTKGRRKETIPVMPELMRCVRRYRAFRGLSDIPQKNEKTPMVMSLNSTLPLSTGMVYKVLCTFFRRMAKDVQTSDPELSSVLAIATPHWIRHTAITHLTDQALDNRYIQRFARHKSANTTARYQHIEENRWHDALTALSN